MSALPSDDTFLQADAELSEVERMALEMGTFPRITDKATRHRYVEVPSRTVKGRVHFTNLNTCTCPGFQFRAKCAHVEALRMYRDMKAVKAVCD